MAAESNEIENKASTVNIPENAITTLTVEEIYDRDRYDLSTMEIDDVFKMLNATSEGLTKKEVNKRLEKFGYNRIDYKKKENFLVSFAPFLWNPHSWAIEIAALIAIIVLSWENFFGILLVLLTNSIICFVQRRHTENHAKAFMKVRIPEATVKRNGEWKVIEAAELVPGDIINIKSGDVIPADVRLVAAHDTILIDQSGLTGEQAPVNKSVGDEIISGATCKQGEAEAIVIGTGCNGFFRCGIPVLQAPKSNKNASLQMVLTHISYVCIVVIIIFMIAEILVMYAVFRYDYRRGMYNLLVLFIGGIPIIMPTVLSVIAAIGVKQLAKHYAIVTHVRSITELGAITILCFNKTGILTSNKLIIDKSRIKKYSDVTVDEIIHYAAIASETKNQDAIDACVTEAYGGIENIRDGIEELMLIPFNQYEKRTEITYKLISDNSVHRVTKGLPHFIMDLCTRDKTDELIRQLNADVDEFEQSGLRTLAIAIEDEGNGFKLIGLLPIRDPLRLDTKEAINRALQLNLKVKMLTGDRLSIAKEIGRYIGIGDNIFLPKALRDEPQSQSGYRDIDDLVLHADGFAGIYPEHKYEIVRRLQSLGHSVALTGDSLYDAPAVSKADIGIAVVGSEESALSATDVILTEPGVSVIIEAIVSSREIFQRMRNYIIYTCSITIRIIIAFSSLIFAFKFDFPPFMILVLVIINESTIMMISIDRVQQPPYPNSWNLPEIFVYAIVYGIYLAASTIAFFSIVVKTSFFQEKINVEHVHYNHLTMNDPKLHSIIYLQVSTISQALIFIIRSRSFFFLERPSMGLLGAFCISQLIATFIAVWADWSFTSIHGCGWHWAGIIWIWNIIWFFPLDFLKFTVRAFFDRNTGRKSTINNIGAKYYEPRTDHSSTPDHQPCSAPVTKIDLGGTIDLPLAQVHEGSKLLNEQGENLDHRTTTAV